MEAGGVNQWKIGDVKMRCALRLFNKGDIL
jgi:hypothetical protein